MAERSKALRSGWGTFGQVRWGRKGRRRGRRGEGGEEEKEGEKRKERKKRERREKMRRFQPHPSDKYHCSPSLHAFKNAGRDSNLRLYEKLWI